MGKVVIASIFLLICIFMILMRDAVPLLGFLCFVFGIIGLIFFVPVWIYCLVSAIKERGEKGKYQAVDPKAREEAEIERMRKIKELYGFSKTKQLSDHVMLDEKNKLIFFDYYIKDIQYISKKNFYKYSDLLEFELVENGEKQNISTNTERHGTVGRAIVGGALFGAVGAVVGASTSPTTSTSKTTTTIDKMYINLYMVDGEKKDITLIYSKTDKNSEYYRKARSEAEKIIAVLHAIKHSSSQ